MLFFFKLDESALEQALLELNQDFLDDLPETPQKLFEYTSRFFLSRKYKSYDF